MAIPPHMTQILAPSAATFITGGESLKLSCIPWIRNALPPAQAALLLREQQPCAMFCHIAGLGDSPGKQHQEGQNHRMT